MRFTCTQHRDKSESFVSITECRDATTEMKLPLLLLLLVTIMAQVGTSFPSDRRALPGGRNKHASWDDVNVVAHGLLQLGQGLKEHVDKIKAQMRDVNAKLRTFNVTVTELVRKQQERDEALKTRGEEEVEETARTKVEEEMKKESEIIHSRMDRLEEKVDKAFSELKVESNFSDGTGAPFIQVRGKHCYIILACNEVNTK